MEETTMFVSALAVTAATWGVVMALSPVLQIRRMIQRRSSDDLSIGYLIVLIIGFAVWLAYGASIGNLALVIPNSVALIVSIATLIVAGLYRSPGRRTEGIARRNGTG
jgi:MtN3 and saliva related transmembrane protein